MNKLLEWLMTYGWAILIIIVVIAALYNLGVFYPPKIEENYITINCWNEATDECKLETYDYWVMPLEEVVYLDLECDYNETHMICPKYRQKCSEIEVCCECLESSCKGYEVAIKACKEYLRKTNETVCNIVKPSCSECRNSLTKEPMSCD